MKFYDAVELAGRNLRESVLRNALTTVGIAVGVASLVAMLSLGVGLQQLAGRRLERSGLFNTVVVFENRQFGPGQRGGQPRATTESKPVDEDARRAIEHLPHVQEVYPEVRFTSEVRFNNASHFGMVAALPTSAGESDAFESLQGKFFSAPDSHEAILQTEFAAELAQPPSAAATPGTAPAPPSTEGGGGTSLAAARAEKAAQEKLAASMIGKDVVLRYAERQPNRAPVADGQAPAAGNNPRARAADAAADEINAADWGFSVIPRELTLRIVGVSDEEPYGGMRSFARGRVFVPLQVALKMNVMQPADLRSAMRSSSPTYGSLTAKVDSPNNVQGVEDAVKRMGYATFSLLDATKNLRRFFAILDLFLGIFGSLALAVASLGIVNTLVMAILERRREIGIMKAIGASDGDVRSLFFAEAGAMGVLGGGCGVLLGWTIGRIINFGTNFYLERQQLPPENIWAVPWWLVAGAIAFSLVVSLGAGLYPASRAARLNPVEALRYE